MLQLCLNDFGCKCQDAANNTYVCLRTLSPSGPNNLKKNKVQEKEEEREEDSLYCQFDDSENFVELYDLRVDPYQLKNRAYSRSCRCTTPNVHRHKMLVNYSKCRGHVNCFFGSLTEGYHHP